MVHDEPADPESVVIIGAGQAGATAADALRRFGFAGSITLAGEEEVSPYERPPLSKDILLGKMQPEHASIFKDSHWANVNVSFKRGVRVESIDRVERTVALHDRQRLPYDALVIATGVRPRRLDAVPENDPRVHYLRTREDAQRLKAALVPGCRLVILGAGFIGLEVAASARRLGVDVVVIEAADWPLARLLPRSVADWFSELHAKEGVDVRCGQLVREFVSYKSRLALVLDDGCSITADIVLVGVGAVPNSELAQACGINCRDGIVVDEQCRTSDRRIFAIGDVTRHVDPRFECEWRLESWRNALVQAERSASAICGTPAPRYEVPWFWTDQFGRNVQIAGVIRDNLTVIERGDAQSGPYLALFLENETIHGAVAIDAGRDMRLVRDLIRDVTIVDPAMLANSTVRLSALRAKEPS